VAEPSRADELLTQHLSQALALVDVRVVDHFIVGAGEVVSLRRAGLAVTPTVQPCSFADLKPLARERGHRKAGRRAERARRAPPCAWRSRSRRVFELHRRPGDAAAQRDRVIHELEQPAPEPRQREAGRARRAAQALSDEIDVDTLLDTDETLSFRREGISLEVVRKLRRGHWSCKASSTCTACAATRPANSWACSSTTAPGVACAACAWSTARATARRAASPC
jgi:hypothetical protein